MKILFVVGPAFGILNHSIALSNLLAKGGYEVVWLTSPMSEGHLQSMGIKFPATYSTTHDINFDKTVVSRKPHLQQVCDYQYLKKAIELELELIQKQKPDLVITKHHYSVPVSAAVSNIPFLNYYTDGGEYLMKGRNPQSKRSEPELLDNLKKIYSEYKLTRQYEELTDYIKSPFINIIRGIPLLSSLTTQEQSDLHASAVFGGLLYYDGEDRNQLDQLNLDPRLPIIYITFGTICRDVIRFKNVMDRLSGIQANIVISTVHIDPNALLPCPSNVFLVKYIPNDLILQKASLLIHHGGHGTMLSSFNNGVPQIILPENTESSAQGIHAKIVENLECGKCLSYEQIGELRNLVITILNDTTYKKKAMQLKEQVRSQNEDCNRNFLSKLTERMADTPLRFK